MLSKKRLDEMGEIGAWVFLGLHKGKLREETITIGEGRERERTVRLRYYYIGLDSEVGVCDSHSRRVLPASIYLSEDWYDTFQSMSPSREWRGPSVCEHHKDQTKAWLREAAREALEYLNEGVIPKGDPVLKAHGKPKPVLPMFRKPVPKTLKSLPLPYIRHEDRPDTGTITKPRPKGFVIKAAIPVGALRKKKKPAFKLRRKRHGTNSRFNDL